MSRIFPITLMTCALLLTACGGGGTPTQEPSAPPTTPAPPQEPPAPPTPPSAPISTLPPQTLRTTSGGTVPITSATTPKPRSAITVTLKNAPKGLTLQLGDAFFFNVPNTVATLKAPTTLPVGTYTFSTEITIDGVTTITPTTLDIAAWRSYPLPENTKPAAIVSDQQGDAYVIAADCRRIERIDRNSGTVTTYNAPTGQCFVGLDIAPDNQLWTWETVESHLTQLDPATGKFTTLTGSSVTDPPRVMADGTVWWFHDTTLNQLDPRTKITRTYPVETSALGSFMKPHLTSPQISGDGYAWFIANGIPRQLGRLKLSSGAVDFFDEPSKFQVQAYTLTSQGPWLTYTPYQTNNTVVGQLDSVTRTLSKTIAPPQKYGVVGLGRIMADRDNTLLFGQNGEGPASLTRINIVDGTSFNYWLTTQPTKIYDYTLSTSGSIWTADLANDTVNLFTPSAP